MSAKRPCSVLAPPKLVVTDPEVPSPSPVNTVPAMAEEVRKTEALKARKAHHLLESIRSVERFTGDPRELELFLDEMEAVHGLVTHTKIDTAIDQDIWRVFVSRISRQVLMETGIRYAASWAEIKATLKERYAGAKKPLARDALSLLRMNRRSGETAAEFARRLGEGSRILNKKINEAVDDSTHAVITTKIFDELLRELLCQQVPEKTRAMLKVTRPQTMEAAATQVRNEEEDEKDYRAVTTMDWQVVERRRPPPRVSRPEPARPRFYPPRREERPPPKRAYPEARRATGRREPTKRRYRQECWECKEEGHFARDCPYMYRRQEGHRRTYADAARPEPMEINAVEHRPRRIGRGGATSDVSDLSGSESDSGSVRSATRGPGRTRRGDPAGMGSTLALKTEKQD